MSEGSLAHDKSPRADKAVVTWLAILLAMVFVMVLIGGLTRLTQSGLSMVAWEPITGWLPPTTEQAWQDAFAQYRQFPEYRHLNVGMTLDEFKDIYLMEYVHRLWGRVMAVVLLVPLAYFAWRRRIDGGLVAQLGLIFLLGVAQAGMGWYMVMSGLNEDPDVSPYRLTAHLGLGALILGVLSWALFSHARPAAAQHGSGARRAVRGLSVAVAGMVFTTILSGGFVAGLDAGFTYNTFPLMDGRLIPEGLADLQPVYRNLFENITTVQFNHRILAISTFLAILMLWLSVDGRRLSAGARRAATLLLAMAVVQVGLGISTLLLVVPVPLALAHQGGAMVLFGLALWTVYELRPPIPGVAPPHSAAAAAPS